MRLARIASALALAFPARSTNPPATGRTRESTAAPPRALATPRFSRRSRRSSAHLAQTANDALRVRPANAPLAPSRARRAPPGSARRGATAESRRGAARDRSKVVRRSFEGLLPNKKKNHHPQNRIARTSARYARNTRPRRVAWYAPYAEPVEAKGLRERASPRTRRDASSRRRGGAGPPRASRAPPSRAPPPPPTRTRLGTSARGA